MAPVSAASVSSKTKSIKLRYIGRGKTCTFVRDDEQEYEYGDALCESQLVIKDGEDPTDVNLICDGGVVRANSVFLCAVSPLFQKVIASQGESYLLMRDIILPDYSLIEIQRVVQLIYTGFIYVANEEEVISLKKVLVDFQIENLGKVVTKKFTKQQEVISEIVDDVCVQNLHSTINNQGPTEETDSTKLVDCSSEDNDNAENNPVGRKRHARTNKCTNQNNKDLVRDEDRAIDESLGKKPSKMRKTILNTEESSSVLDRSFEVIPRQGSSKKCKSLDSDNDEWCEPNYKEKNWFSTEAKKCQFCKKVYEYPQQASECIKGHNRLRCYFCFRVCKNTQILYDHYVNIHKRVGSRGDCILCPYCNQKITIKTVSSHVINTHLLNMLAEDKLKKTAKSSATTVVKLPSRSQGPGKLGVLTSTAHVASKLKVSKEMSGSTKKISCHGETESEANKRRITANQTVMERSNKTIGNEDDDGLIRVRDLDVTISKKGLNGKIWVWKIKKEAQKKSSKVKISKVGPVV